MKATQIEYIYSKGESLFLYPFKVYYLQGEFSAKDRVAVSVPKKLFKRAVKRNLIRRRTKEAFRLSIQEISIPDNLAILFVYTTGTIQEYKKIYESVQDILKRLS